MSLAIKVWLIWTSRLTVRTHHCVMDANCNEQFILQLASLCRGEKLSEEDIRLGNADQNTIVPPPEPGQDLEPLELYRCPSSLGAPRGTWPPPPSTSDSYIPAYPILATRPG